MGKSRYESMQEILEPIVGEVVPLDKLWRRIMIMVGSDKRTLREYINTMVSLGMIVEVSDRNYKIISNKANI